VVLIPLVETLSVISAWNELGHILPIYGSEILRLCVPLLRVCVNSPVKELSLIIIPITLSRIFSINNGV